MYNTHNPHQHPPYGNAPNNGAYSVPKNIKLRQLQVDNVLKKFPNARIISYDRSVVDVPMLLSNNAQITCRITLSQAFPDVPPVMVLLARCANHPMLNQYSAVVHPELTHARWTVHSSLADVLAIIFAEFKQNPPKIVSYAPPPPMPMSMQTPPQQQQQQQQQPPPSSQYTQYNPQQQQQQQQQQPPAPSQTKPLPDRPRVAIPTVPNTYPEVDKLTSLSEIEDLLKTKDDSEQWQHFFENLDYVKNLRGVRQSLMEENKLMAERNIDKDKELVDLYNTNKELNKQLHEQLRSRVEEKTKERQDIEQRKAPMALLQLLRQRIRESEEESDDIADKFIQRGSESNVDEFVEAFMEKRTLMHLRTAKKERFEKIYCR